MLSSLDPKSTNTLHRNRDCSANSGSTETKTIIWRLCCTCIVNFVIIMNSLFKLFEILAWIIRSGGFDGKKIIIIKKKKKKINKLQIARQTSSCIF